MRIIVFAAVVVLVVVFVVVVTLFTGLGLKTQLVMPFSAPVLTILTKELTMIF